MLVTIFACAFLAPLAISLCSGCYPHEYYVEVNLTSDYPSNSEFVSRFELSENEKSVLLDYSLAGNNYTTDNNTLARWPTQVHSLNETQIDAINKSNKIVLQKSFIVPGNAFEFYIKSVKVIIGQDGVVASVNETNNYSKENFHTIDVERSAINNSRALICYKANWLEYFAVNFMLGLLLAAGVLAILLKSEEN